MLTQQTQQNRANYFVIPLSLYNKKREPTYYKLRDLEDITKIVIEEKIPVKRGDLIRMECASYKSMPHLQYYRNEGLLMWDGNKIIDLQMQPDDYGSVPEVDGCCKGICRTFINNQNNVKFTHTNKQCCVGR
jgi:hypothetical protein